MGNHLLIVELAIAAKMITERFASIALVSCFLFIQLVHGDDLPCAPRGSVGECERCLQSPQCKEGYYCCPFLKLCVKSAPFECTKGVPARCSPSCYDNMDFESCKCEINGKNGELAKFPEEWRPVCDVEYELGEKNTQCEEGTYIKDNQECFRAANEFLGLRTGPTYVYDDDPPTPNYPKGCYKSGPVWFNDHATGSTDKYSQPICIKKGSCETWKETCEPDLNSHWCTRTEPGYGKDHTMCKYPDCHQRPCGCVHKKFTGITDQSVKDAIVEKHNELRSKIARGDELRGVENKPQPSATNMRQMIWSDELAEVAQRWANQCSQAAGNGAHDKLRRTDKFPQPGQNVASLYNDGGKQIDLATKMVGLWYDKEVIHMPPAAVSEFPKNATKAGATGEIGHYTQIVWAETSEVGCGYIRYTDEEGTVTDELVCNYGPGGNYHKKPIYDQGEPGSKCPDGTSVTDQKLCG